MKFCEHISYDKREEKYLAIEPSVVEPIATDTTKFKCSTCQTKFPIIKRSNGRIRIKLIKKEMAK